MTHHVKVDGGSRSRRWISSSFYSEEKSDMVEIKRKREERSFTRNSMLHAKKVSSSQGYDLWIEKYKPITKSDLLVHKQKVLEIENWLKLFDCDGNVKLKPSYESSILVLQGPVGAGKTATVDVLAKHLCFELKEWINPIAPQVNGYLHENDDWTLSESQVKGFWDFMLRGAKYCSVPFVSEPMSFKNVLLIEDIPNVFLRNPSELHNVLRKFSAVSRNPAVFVVSDGNTDSNMKKLFPHEFQKELGIKTISFNPVSPKNMLRLLNVISKAEGFRISSSSLDILVEMSAGDVRMAINTLQFSYSKPNTRVTLSRKCGKNRKVIVDTSDNSQFHGNKDSSLFIFHAIGKVLHCKRDTGQSTDSDLLPPGLAAMARKPLISDPEDIVSRSNMSFETFGSFLHENYLNFFKTIGDVMRASNYLSEAGFCTTEWTSKAIMDECSNLIAVRGLLHSNSGGTSTGWKPIYKPGWYEVNKLINKRKMLLHQCCRSFGILTNVMTDILPYSYLMRHGALSLELANLSKEICDFPRGGMNNSSWRETIDSQAATFEEQQPQEEAFTSQRENTDAETVNETNATDSEYEIEEISD